MCQFLNEFDWIMASSGNGSFQDEKSCKKKRSLTSKLKDFCNTKRALNCLIKKHCNSNLAKKGCNCCDGGKAYRGCSEPPRCPSNYLCNTHSTVNDPVYEMHTIVCITKKALKELSKHLTAVNRCRRFNHMLVGGNINRIISITGELDKLDASFSDAHKNGGIGDYANLLCRVKRIRCTFLNLLQKNFCSLQTKVKLTNYIFACLTAIERTIYNALINCSKAAKPPRESKETVKAIDGIKSCSGLKAKAFKSSSVTALKTCADKICQVKDSIMTLVKSPCRKESTCDMKESSAGETNACCPCIKPAGRDPCPKKSVVICDAKNDQMPKITRLEMEYTKYDNASIESVDSRVTLSKESDIFRRDLCNGYIEGTISQEGCRQIYRIRCIIESGGSVEETVRSMKSKPGAVRDSLDSMGKDMQRMIEMSKLWYRSARDLCKDLMPNTNSSYR